jgi:hypothetical protein
MSISNPIPKFSELYIKYNTVRTQRFLSFDSKTNETIFTISEYQQYKVIKEFIPKDKNMYYLWGNIGYALMFDNHCIRNEKIKKLTDLCLFVENKIKKGDIDIVFYDFVNDVFPLLDSLTINEIKMIEEADRISSGPLYQKLINIRTPEIFIDLCNYAKHYS